jgi:inosose dehydratase
VKKEKMSFLQAVKAGVFTVPGDGIIDYESLFKVLDDHQYEGWFVVEAEQDPALANPLEYAIKARQYIREKTGL